MGWEAHAIAAFAGHRPTDSTLDPLPGAGGRSGACWTRSTTLLQRWKPRWPLTGAGQCSTRPRCCRCGAPRPAGPTGQGTEDEWAGGFTAFHRLGSFSRLTLAWRVLGRDRVNSEIGRIRSVPAGWAYRLGREDNRLPLMVASRCSFLTPALIWSR
jgi:hypothetical protein